MDDHDEDDEVEEKKWFEFIQKLAVSHEIP